MLIIVQFNLHILLYCLADFLVFIQFAYVNCACTCYTASSFAYFGQLIL